MPVAAHHHEVRTGLGRMRRDRRGHVDIAGGHAFELDLKAVARYSGSSPHHQAGLQSLVNLPGGGEVDASYRYVSALPAQNVAAYHEADLRFGWAASPALELSVAGQNLLSPYHLEFGHGTPPGVGIARSVYVEVKWRRVRP